MLARYIYIYIGTKQQECNEFIVRSHWAGGSCKKKNNAAEEKARAKKTHTKCVAGLMKRYSVNEVNMGFISVDKCDASASRVIGRLEKVESGKHRSV